MKCKYLTRCQGWDASFPTLFSRVFLCPYKFGLPVSARNSYMPGPLHCVRISD